MEDLFLAPAEHRRVSTSYGIAPHGSPSLHKRTMEAAAAAAAEDVRDLFLAPAEQRCISTSYFAPHGNASPDKHTMEAAAAAVEVVRDLFVAPGIAAHGDASFEHDMEAADGDKEEHSYVVVGAAADEHSYVVATADAGILVHTVYGLGKRILQGILVLACGFQVADSSAHPTSSIVRGSALMLPDPGLINMNNVGLISVPGTGGREFAVAELRLIDGGDEGIDHAKLLCFLSSNNTWIEKELVCSSCPKGWPKDCHDVLAHDAKLWWVNLDWGLLVCDPLCDLPEVVLRHIVLPFTFNMEPAVNVQSVRMVGLSQGKLRYVDIVRDSMDPVEETTIVIKWLDIGSNDKPEWKYQVSKTLGWIWKLSGDGYAEGGS